MRIFPSIIVLKAFEQQQIKRKTQLNEIKWHLRLPQPKKIVEWIIVIFIPGKKFHPVTFPSTISDILIAGKATLCRFFILFLVQTFVVVQKFFVVFSSYISEIRKISVVSSMCFFYISQFYLFYFPSLFLYCTFEYYIFQLRVSITSASDNLSTSWTCDLKDYGAIDLPSAPQEFHKN